MAAVGNRSTAARRKPSRLQRRAPASIEISPVSQWNVAIPLLSPLVQSPTSPNYHPTAEIKPPAASSKESSSDKAAAVVAASKKWQHPAAPFCYGPPAPPSFLPFVCTVRGGSFDR